MYASVRREIPEFLIDQVAYCVNIITSNNLKSTLVLTKQANLYEFRHKILLNQINLLNTCLAKDEERLKNYTGYRGQWFENENQETKAYQKHVINFDKYIYMNNYPIKCYYILLQCWQQLVVIERLGDHKGLRIAAEYPDIINYNLIHGSSAYQPVLQIHLQNGLDVETDFQSPQNQGLPAETVAQQNDENLRDEFSESLMEKQKLETDLQIAGELTKCELMRVRNQLTFGNDLVRSSEIQEKQQLTRYGDVWLRFSNNQKLIVGVPLVNNCTPPNLTILKHIRAVFINSSSAIYTTEEPLYSYTYRLYQLKMQFENLESLESFFQCDDAPAYEASGWQECHHNQMPPEMFAVVCVVIDMKELALLHECSLHISYEIEKNLQLLAGRAPKIVVFKQQLFIKKFIISEILAQHAALSIRFDAVTLHQDLLAVLSSSFELKLNIHFSSIEDAEKFERILANHFKCELIKRAAKLNASSTMAMELEETHADTEIKNFPHMLWYTKQINSMWHGLLVIREAHGTQDELQWLWKFYTGNESHTILLLRILLDDFLRNGINIKGLTCNDGMDTEPSAAAALYEAIKVELHYVNFILSTEEDIGFKQHLLHMQELNKLQLKTDQAMFKLHRKGNKLLTAPTTL